MTNEERYWLAGLLEGEGCFSIDRAKGARYRYPRISLRMADRDIVQRAADLMGCRKLYPVPPAIKWGGKLPTWVAILQGQPAVRIMYSIYPLLGERRRAKIDTVLHECDPDGNRYTAAVQRKEED